MVDRREKKESEAQPEESEEAQRTKAMRKYAVWTGIDGKRYTNAAYVRVYGLSNEDLKGVTVLGAFGFN